MTSKQKLKLLSLIWAHENAVRDYAFARGLRAGLTKSGSFNVDPYKAIIDYAKDADTAEDELNNFIEKIEITK